MDIELSGARDLVKMVLGQDDVSEMDQQWGNTRPKWVIGRLALTVIAVAPADSPANAFARAR